MQTIEMRRAIYRIRCWTTAILHPLSMYREASRPLICTKGDAADTLLHQRAQTKASTVEI